MRRSFYGKWIIAACLLLGGALLSGLLLRPLRPRPAGEVNVAECAHCGISSPQQSPRCIADAQHAQ